MGTLEMAKNQWVSLYSMVNPEINGQQMAMGDSLGVKFHPT